MHKGRSEGARIHIQLQPQNGRGAAGSHIGTERGPGGPGGGPGAAAYRTAAWPQGPGRGRGVPPERPPAGAEPGAPGQGAGAGGGKPRAQAAAPRAAAWGCGGGVRDAFTGSGRALAPSRLLLLVQDDDVLQVQLGGLAQLVEVPAAAHLLVHDDLTQVLVLHQRLQAPAGPALLPGQPGTPRSSGLHSGERGPLEETGNRFRNVVRKCARSLSGALEGK
uniref:Uncharacterized protein n=1 Tax=Spironucleus salmonicida TaxID=348837 RepID=V6M1C6_9EUKA|eukprot:EST46984.1 Hypothetical protein SS50377_12936 [Spironucleus salmonicida]